MKKTITIIIGIILVIAVIVTGIIAIKSTDKKVEYDLPPVVNESKEANEITGNNIEEAKEPSQSIEEYIESIYPIKAGESIPVFENINEADSYWIWSTAIKNCGTKEMGAIGFKKKDAIKNAKRLFGSNIPDFPENNDELLSNFDIDYSEENDIYSWIGNSSSIADTSYYIITSQNRENNQYEVEIAEYIVYEWSEPYVLIKDLDGNTLANFRFNVDYTGNDDLEVLIKDFIDNNMDKLNKKILTIKVDIKNGLYNIVSVKNV